MKKFDDPEIIWGILAKGISHHDWEQLIFGYILLVDHISEEFSDWHPQRQIEFGNAGAYHAINNELADVLAEKFPDKNFFTNEDLLYFFLPPHETACIDSVIETLKKRKFLPIPHK